MSESEGYSPFIITDTLDGEARLECFVSFVNFFQLTVTAGLIRISTISAGLIALNGFYVHRTVDKLYTNRF